MVTNNGTISVARWETVSLDDEDVYWCQAKFGDKGTLTSASTQLYVRGGLCPAVDFGQRSRE